MTEMIQEPNDESEVDADALIELVDAKPGPASHTPPPPPVIRKSSPADAAASSPAGDSAASSLARDSAASSPAASETAGTRAAEPDSKPAAESPPAAGPESTAARAGATPESIRPPLSSKPPFSSGRLSSLPLAPPRPGAPSLNPITDRPSAPPRASSVPRAPAIPSQVRVPAEKVDEPLAAVKAELDLARRAVSAKEGELRALLVQRDALILELETVRHQLASRELAVKEVEFAALAKDTRIRELEKELEEARAQAGDAADDLKLIKGIGPGFERELKRLGIRKFSQIAAWTDEDVETIAKKIKAKSERIRRDDWIARAAELARGQSQT